MKQTYLFLADGFEEIEAVATIDILRRAEIFLKTVSIKDTLSVTGAHGVTLKADQLISDTSFDDIELLILPGGMPGTSNLELCAPLIELLKQHHANQGKIAAICAAPMILGKLGLLKGEQATCYPSFEAHLHGTTHSSARVVNSGQFITGKGPGCTIEFALAIVKWLRGENVQMAVADGLIA